MCNIIWYNPPYSVSGKTNIGKIYFNLLSTYFSRGHKFQELFNKTTIKLSYSNTNNMLSLIESHNRFILKPNDQVYGFNCTVRSNCPLQHKCLTPGTVCHAIFTNNKDDVKKFIMVYVKLILWKSIGIIPILFQA